MLKELKYLLFLIVIVLFFFLSFKYYFSNENKKNSYRSLKNIEDKTENYSRNLILLNRIGKTSKLNKYALDQYEIKMFLKSFYE